MAIERDGPVAIRSVEHGDRSGTVRVLYDVPGAHPVGLRRIQCAFAASGLRAGRSEIVSIETRDGAISGASLFLLRRFFLDTPEGEAADPAPTEPKRGVALPPGGALALQLALGAAPPVGIYGLLAAAYALVFGLVRRINLAFGEIAALGGACAVVATLAAADRASVPAAIAFGIVAAMPAAAFHAAALGRVTFALVPATAGQASLVATVGASLALSETLRLAGGGVPLWIPPAGAEPFVVARSGSFAVTLSPGGLATGMAGIGGALALALLVGRSRFGRDWKAWSQDPGAAAMFGIDGDWLLFRTLALAGAAAGLAGALVAAQYGSFGHAAGFGLGLKALAAAVLGGIGSVGGALVGGLLVGTAETLWSALLPIEARDAALHGLLVILIVLKPDGLFASGATRTPSSGS